MSMLSKKKLLLQKYNENEKTTEEIIQWFLSLFLIDAFAL